MGKFCGNCGTQLEDNTKVCGQCGTPIDGASANILGLKMVDLEKQEEMKKKGKRIVTLVVFVIVAVLAFNVISQYTGYNGLLRKVMTAYKEYDIDTLVLMSSDMYFYGEEDWVEYYFESSVGEDLDAYEASVGHNYKLSYEVNEIYTLAERKLNERLEKIEYEYPDFDVKKFKKISIANLTVTAKQGDKSVNRNIDIVMSKENGEWKLLYIE